MAKFVGDTSGNKIGGTDNNDKIFGRAGDDYLFGEGGNDFISGGLGIDALVGSEGDDTLSGGGGFDFAIFLDSPDPVTVDLQKGTATGDGKDVLIGVEGLVGSAFNDELSGDQFGNQIEGAPGNDTLNGRAGNDFLEGDFGRDHLKGGRGNDTFDFDTLDVSPPGHKNRDVIQDFTPGQDKIDIGTISDTLATFIGTAEFSATGKYEVRFASGLVQLDLNGDGVEDLEIEVSGVPFLSATDFIL